MIYLITENLSTLKIHKLTQEQYDRELAAGRIDANALYLTPDEKAPQPNWSQNDTSALDYIKNRTHYIEVDQDGSETVHKLDEKYIPDSFAKTADLENYVTTSELSSLKLATEDFVTEKIAEADLEGKDGYTPVKGTDYWTDADKNEMVADVKSTLTPEDIGALPSASGTMTGQLTAADGIKGVGKNGYIAYPEDAWFTNGYGNDVVGYVRIDLPATVKAGTTVQFKVSIMNLSNVTYVNYIVSGYTYSTGWLNPSAVCWKKQDSANANLPVYFAYENGRYSVLIGDGTLDLRYPDICVSDIHVAHNHYQYADWKSGWNIKMVSERPADAAVITNTNIMHGLATNEALEALTPADIGALNKNGDIMYGDLHYYGHMYINRNYGGWVKTVGNDLDPNVAKIRNSSLNAADTTPTEDGTICWTYK